MATSRKNATQMGTTEVIPGKRSGAIEVPRQKPGEIDSPGAFFEGAKSPDPADIAAGEKPLETTEDKKPQAKRPAQNYRGPRFSLPGAASKDGDDGRPIQESEIHAKVRDLNVSVSPSDLSTVSTAPPTPAAVQSPLISHKETPLVSQQENFVSEDATPESGKKPAAPGEKTDTGVEEPTVEQHDDEEDDDLMPPPPPPEDRPEESSQDHGDYDNNGFEANDQQHEEESFPISQDDNVGIPSEFDAEENKSDDLNEKHSGDTEHENNAKPAGVSQGESTLTEEKKEEDDHKEESTPSKNSQQKDTPDKPAVEEDDESEAERITKTPDNEKAKSATKKTPTDDNASDDFGGGHEDDYDDDDGDKEGQGFNMVHDPETPDSVREERIRREEQMQKAKKKKKRAKTPPPPEETVSDDSDDDTVTPAKPVKKRKNKRKVSFQETPKGYPSGPRDYEKIPADDFVDDSDHPRGVRRSKRARTAPLEYWRNERLEYGPNRETGLLGEAMGNMPVVKNVVKALPTPHKKRKETKPKKSKQSAGKSKSRGGGFEDDSETPFDARRLKKKYKYLDGESAKVWNDGEQDVQTEKVIAYSKILDRHDLPLPATRKKADGKIVGQAAQGFNVRNEANSDNYVGYIMGHLALPPRGIKDYESVGLCAQTFTVCNCQPGSLEVSIADPEDRKYSPDKAQRFLLGPGDMFRIPQNNTYQLQNHSKTLDCILTWTIIRPIPDRSGSD